MSKNGQPACINYKEVYEFYLRLAESYRGKGLKILKTDTHNESGLWAHISLPLAPVLAEGNALTCIEIDKNTLDLARNNYPDLDFRMGDIRTWAGEYDVILDFSTIDHVEAFKPVLQQYRSNAPALSCIVWLSDLAAPQNGQFFFPPNAFRAACAEIYGEYEETLVYEEGPAFLSHFMCSAKADTSATTSTTDPQDSQGCVALDTNIRNALKQALTLHQ